MKVVSLILSLLISLVSFGQGDQTIITVPTGTSTTEGAILHLPDDYSSTTNNYPILIFLHGAGESTGNPASIYNNTSAAGGPAYFIAHNQFPSSFLNPLDGLMYKFIVLSPQTSTGGWSTTAPQLDFIISYMYSHYRCDTTRLYLTGLSAGGEGIMEYCGKIQGDGSVPFTSHRPAAVLPMSAVMNGTQVQRIADTLIADNIALWCFGSPTDTHGANTLNLVYYASLVVPGYGDSTAYAGGHCCWDQFYNPTYTKVLHGTRMSIYQYMLTKVRSTSAPSANAGSNQTLTLPTSSTTLTGAGTAGIGHTISSYAWTKASGPSGGSITSPSSASTGITGLLQGTYTYRLTITQNDAQTATSNVIISVNAASNVPPTVSGGSNQVVTLPNSSVTLTGSASGNSGATISSVLWTEVSGPNSPTIVSPSSPVTQVTGLIVGTYVFNILATDNHGLTANANISVTANNAPSPSLAKYMVANGEYANYLLDLSTNVLYGVGNTVSGIGNNPGFPGLPIQCQSVVDGNNFRASFVAAGLHTASCIDTLGNVYFAGANEDGTAGQGTTTGTFSSFIKIPIDSLGNPFTGITYLKMGSSIFTGGAGFGAIIFAIKSDSTLWVWGNTQGGYRGDGTYGQVNTRPVKVPFPNGIKIVKVFVQEIACALDANGGVWTWGSNNKPLLLGNSTQTDYMTPHLITLPTTAKSIAGAGLFYYALLTDGRLYGWGFYTGYLGVGNTGTSASIPPPNNPMLLDTSLNLPAKISQLSTGAATTYVILTDGTLWAWGANECGQVGNGQEIDWARYGSPFPYGTVTPAPYNFNQDLSTAQLQVRKPVQIARCYNNFIALSEGTAFVFYKFAEDANHVLYSWGRNKTGVLANGTIEADNIIGALGATYPNSWDIDTVMAIYPFYQAFNFGSNSFTTSPWCLTHPTATGCPGTIPTNTPPVINAGANQVTSNSALALSGSATPNGSGVVIAKQVWSLVSPISCPTVIFGAPYALSTTISGLTPGIYIFMLTVTDSHGLISTSTTQVTINPSVPGRYIRQKAAKRKYKVI